MTKSEILRSLNKVIRLYTARGFNIQQIMADNQFECLRDDLLPILLTIVGTGEHVGDIERSIRTIKEGARTTTQGLPFKRYPRVLVDAIIQKAVSDRNSFPEENGISADISPRTIITGQPKIDFNECKLEIGQYCEVYTHPDPTNKQHTRSVGAIALLPSNNHGSYSFMSTVTGEKLNSYIWRELPMSRDIICLVDRLGKKEGQPLINKGGLTFEWAPGDPIFDDEDDLDAFDDDYESEPDAHDDDHILHEDDYDMDIDDPADLLADVQDQRSVHDNGHEQHEHDHDAGGAQDAEDDEHNEDFLGEAQDEAQDEGTIPPVTDNEDDEYENDTDGDEAENTQNDEES